MLRCSAWAEARAAPRRGALFRVEIVCERCFIKVGHEPGSCATCADQVYCFRSGPSPGEGSGARMLRLRRDARVQALRLVCRFIGSSGSGSRFIKVCRETRFLCPVEHLGKPARARGGNGEARRQRRARGPPAPPRLAFCVKQRSPRCFVKFRGGQTGLGVSSELTALRYGLQELRAQSSLHSRT